LTPSASPNPNPEGSKREPGAEELIELAEELRAASNFREAIDPYKSAISILERKYGSGSEALPDTLLPEAKISLTSTLVRVGSYAESIREARSLMKLVNGMVERFPHLEPQLAMLAVRTESLLGTAYGLSENYDRGLQCFQRITQKYGKEQRPDLVEELSDSACAEADLHVLYDQFTSAIRSYGKGLSFSVLNPSAPELSVRRLIRGLMNAHRLNGSVCDPADYGPALASLFNQEELRGTEQGKFAKASVDFDVGLGLAEQGRLNLAYSSVTAAIESLPEHPQNSEKLRRDRNQALAARAAIAARLGKFDQACVDSIDVRLRHSEDSNLLAKTSRLLSHLGYVSLQLGKHCSPGALQTEKFLDAETYLIKARENIALYLRRSEPSVSDFFLRFQYGETFSSAEAQARLRPLNTSGSRDALFTLHNVLCSLCELYNAHTRPSHLSDKTALEPVLDAVRKILRFDCSRPVVH